MNISGLARRRLGDVIVVALLVADVVEIHLKHLPGSRPAFLFASVGWTLVLLLRHRLPLLAPIATTTSFAIASFWLADWMRGTATGVLLLIATSWFVGANNDRRRAAVGLAAMYVGAQITTAHFNDISIGDVVFTSLLVAAPWTAAQAVRSRAVRGAELGARAARLEADRERGAQLAVAEERTRIARELHDVVAHSISVMTIQAGAARLLLDDDPDKAEEALARVEDTGRVTLGEMRTLLGVLRRDMLDGTGLEPRPSLDHVETLLAHYRRSGLDVELAIQGDSRTLPPGVDLAAYRVVQEALTNTLKHAGAAKARVLLVYSPNAVQLEVVDDGRGVTSTPSDGGGHGLVGMRERAAIYGGSLEAGPRAEGGFAVSVRFPIEAATL